MKQRKLNYRFHNPNSTERTADYIMKLFIDANRGKVERAVQSLAQEGSTQTKRQHEVFST